MAKKLKSEGETMVQDARTIQQDSKNWPLVHGSASNNQPQADLEVFTSSNFCQ